VAAQVEAVDAVGVAVVVRLEAPAEAEGVVGRVAPVHQAVD